MLSEQEIDLENWRNRCFKLENQQKKYSRRIR